LSTERLQALAAARQKAAEVRRQKAAQKAESRELQRLEREVERQNLVKRRQELEAKLASGNAPRDVNPPNSPASSGDSTQASGNAPRDVNPPNILAQAKLAKKKRAPPPSPPPSSDSSESEDDARIVVGRKDLTSEYRAKMQQVKEDLVYKSIFG
jgi:hypothetical protein